MSLSTLNQSDVNLLVYEAFGAGAKSYTMQGSKIFTRISPERVDEKFSIHAADGSIPQVAEGAAFPSTNVEEIGSKTISHQTYKREIPLTKLMKVYDNYGVVLEQAQRLGYNSMVAMDQVMADVLNNAEGTTTTFDGLSLANAVHQIGNTANTQNNIVTGTFGKAKVNEALYTLRRQKDHGNVSQPLRGALLVVPPELQMDGFELLGSPDDPETADRSVNYISRTGLDLVTWDLLDSTTDYHIVADKMFSRLRYVVWLEPEVNYVRDTNTGNYQYQIDFDCSAGAPDYLGYVFGNAA